MLKETLKVNSIPLSTPLLFNGACCLYFRIEGLDSVCAKSRSILNNNNQFGRLYQKLWSKELTLQNKNQTRIRTEIQIRTVEFKVTHQQESIDR